MLDKPKSERQCRPIALLLKLGSEYVSEVWTKVVGLKDTKITAKLVEEVRQVIPVSCFRSVIAMNDSAS